MTTKVISELCNMTLSLSQSKYINLSFFNEIIWTSKPYTSKHLFSKHFGGGSFLMKKSYDQGFII